MSDAPPPQAPGFEALVRAHQSRVRQQLRRLTRGDHALADDLAQETFVQAWRHIGSFRGDARVGTWLFRIAYNTFLAQRRREREHAPLHEQDAPALADVSGDAVQRIDVERALVRCPRPSVWR